AAHSSFNVCPLRRCRRSSRVRRLASARARKTSSSLIGILCNRMVACQGAKKGHALASPLFASTVVEGVELVAIQVTEIGGVEAAAAVSRGTFILGAEAHRDLVYP